MDRKENDKNSIDLISGASEKANHRMESILSLKMPRCAVLDLKTLGQNVDSLEFLVLVISTIQLRIGRCDR